MSNGFPLVPLGEVAAPVERRETPILGKTYRQIGVRLWGEGAYEREPIDGGQTKYKTLSRVGADDIIVNKIWARNGSVGVVPESLAGSYGSNEFPTFAPIREKLDSRWVHWLTKTKGFWAQCDEKSRGTSGKNRIRPERFLEIKIPLPPLPEQRRIVARIENLAARIEEARGLRREAVEEAEALVSSLHMHSSQPESMRLGEILELYEQKETVQIGKSYPQIGVRGFGQGLFAKEAVDDSQTTYKSFNHLYEGALVLSQVKGWEGAIAVCPDKLAGRYASPEYRTFRCIPGKTSPEYLAALVGTSWFWNQLKNLTRGVGARRERTRPEQFLNMSIPMPTLERQTQALSILKNLETIKPIQDETAAELDALLPSVLDRAFKGKL